MRRQLEGNTPVQDTARFSNKTTSWLRRLKLGDAVFSKFLKMKDSSAVHRKLGFAFYAIPTSFVFLIAALNCMQQSFMVYLRYQALIDSYYFNIVCTDDQPSQTPSVKKAIETISTATASTTATDKVDS